MNPTTEQQTIIASAKERKNLAIQAYAGAAKTTTCVMVANEVIKPSLYIAFNKDIAEEAKGKFPSHVTCQTIHSLAYKAIVKFPKSKMGSKLSANLDMQDIFNVMGSDDIEMALVIKKVITLFCQSDSFSLKDFVKDVLEGEYSEESIKFYIPACLTYWGNLINELSTTKISHDVYLKLYHLSEPVLLFDVIYLDEFQDTNKVCLDIFLNQKHAQLIAVGDPYQSIYAFRGAVNAFEYIPDTFLKLKLSSSFRFTPEVAELAKKAIRLFGDEIDVIGEASTGSISTRAVICRTNIGVLKEILSYGDKGLKVYSNINLKETFAKLFHIEAVMFGNKPKFPVKEFAYYNDFKDIKKASEVDQDIKSLLDILNFIKGKHSGVFAFKKSIEETLVKESLADVTISTCHKVKGLEYDSVTLSEDFCKLPKDMEIEFWLSGLDVQEYNLIYIGITRGKFEVKLPEVLQIVLKEPRKWKDKADTARELRKKMLFAA